MSKPRRSNPELVVANLATKHHGVITRAQAQHAGLTNRQIDYRLEVGRWRRLDRGVYSLNGSPTSWRQSLLVSCEAAGAGAVASHLSAAALHGLATPPPTPWITVTSAGHHRVGQLHRSPLARQDTTQVDGIPSTTVPRTVIDCAMVCSDRHLAGIIDDTLTKKLCTPRHLRAALSRVEARPGRKGSGRIRRLLDVWDSGITPESPAEARLVRRIRDWGLPDPVLQHVIADRAGAFVGRVDLAWPRKRFAIEYDGLRYHGPNAWMDDEARHEALERLGWEVRHVERSDLVLGADNLRMTLIHRLR